MVPKNNCHLCGSPEQKVLGSKKIDGEIVYFLKCKKCGLIYCHPIYEVDMKELNQTYEETYYERYTPKYRGKPYPKEKIEKKPFTLIKCNQNHELVKEIEGFKPGKGKILDVGCGAGWLLWHAHDMGWQAYGIDICKAVIDSNKRFHKWGKFFYSTLEKAKFKKESFDVVVLNHVLEHSPDPSRLLQECSRVLKKDGLLYVAVPNTNSFHSWLKKLKFRLGIKADYGSLHPPVHWYDFSEKTLSGFLEKNGFKIASVRMLARGGKLCERNLRNTFYISIERLVNLDFTYFLEVLTNKKTGLRVYANNIK